MTKGQLQAELNSLKKEYNKGLKEAEARLQNYADSIKYLENANKDLIDKNLKLIEELHIFRFTYDNSYKSDILNNIYTTSFISIPSLSLPF